MDEQFIAALLAPARAPEISEEDDIYGCLLGSWSAEVVDLDDEGRTQRQPAEIHFVRTLEGRAIQDLWIVPPRHLRTGPVRERNRYGTTIRVFDAVERTWRVTWINPVAGTEMRLIARRVGDDIVQEGTLPSGELTRWSFREITTSSFHWVAQRSVDGGRTWLPDTEFFAHR